MESQQTKLPDQGTEIQFEKYNNQFECPLVIYAEFECLTANSNQGV